MMDDDVIVPLMVAETVPHSRVIIAHGSTGREAAEALRDTLRDLDADKPTPLLFDVEDVHDLPGLSVRFERLGEEPYGLQPPYRLDYTAGSREQMIASVWKHLDDHADVQDSDRLRSYVENYSGHVFLDGEVFEGTSRPVNTKRINLAAMVALQGYELAAGTGNVRVKPGMKAQLRTAAEHLAELLADKRFDRRIPGVVEATRAVVQCLEGVEDATDFRGPGGNRPGAQVNGDALETLVLGSLALGIGDADEEVELSMGVLIVSASGSGESPGKRTASAGRPVVEFDAVLRVGPRVHTFEVKASARNANAVLPERETKARVFFGSESFSSVITREYKPNPSLNQGMQELVDDINSLIPTRNRLNVWSFKGSDLVDDLEQYAERALGWRNADTPRYNDTVDNSAAADGGLLFCGLGNRQGIELVISQTDDASPVAFTMDGQEHNDLDEVGCDPMKWVTAERVFEATAHNVAEAVEPEIVSTMTGPKSACAGFIRYAWGSTGRTIVHVGPPDTDRPRCVWRGTPADEWKVSGLTGEMSWSSILTSAGFREVDVDNPKWGKTVQELLARTVDAAGSRVVTAWLPPPEQRDVGMTHFLMTTDHATCSVSVVGEEFGCSEALNFRGGMKDQIRAILDFELKIENLVGYDNGHIVIRSAVSGKGDPTEVTEDEQHVQKIWDIIAKANEWTAMGSAGRLLGDKWHVLLDGGAYRWVK